MVVFIATLLSQFVIYFYEGDNENILVPTALIVMTLLSIIYEIIFYGASKIGEWLLVLILVFYGYCISFLHIDILFKRRNIRMYHYPIIHTSLHYDMFLMLLFYLFAFETN